MNTLTAHQIELLQSMGLGYLLGALSIGFLWALLRQIKVARDEKWARSFNAEANRLWDARPKTFAVPPGCPHCIEGVVYSGDPQHGGVTREVCPDCCRRDPLIRRALRSFINEMGSEGGQ